MTIVHYKPSKQSKHPMQPKTDLERNIRDVAMRLRVQAASLDVAWKERGGTTAERVDIAIEDLEDALSMLRPIRAHLKEQL